MNYDSTSTAPTITSGEEDSHSGSPSQVFQDLLKNSRSVGLQGRRYDRFPICCTMQLTPIDENGKLLHEKTIDIVSRDLSVAGIGFSHKCPLPYRRAVISLDDPDVGRFVVEAEIVWTKPTLIGLYESGCRFVQKAVGHKIGLNGYHF